MKCCGISFVKQICLFCSCVTTFLSLSFVTTAHHIHQGLWSRSRINLTTYSTTLLMLPDNETNKVVTAEWKGGDNDPCRRDRLFSITQVTRRDVTVTTGTLCNPTPFGFFFFFFFYTVRDTVQVDRHMVLFGELEQFTSFLLSFIAYAAREHNCFLQSENGSAAFILTFGSRRERGKDGKGRRGGGR